MFSNPLQCIRVCGKHMRKNLSFSRLWKTAVAHKTSNPTRACTHPCIHHLEIVRPLNQSPDGLHKTGKRRLIFNKFFLLVKDKYVPEVRSIKHLER